MSHIPVGVILNDKTVLPGAASPAAHLVYEQLKALQTHQGTEAKGVQTIIRYIDLSEKPSKESLEIAPGIVPHFDQNNNFEGINIDNAGQILNLPEQQIEAFKQGMKSAGADFRFISYPGAMHSFTNPEATELGKKFNCPIAYNGDADKESWGEMKDFLKKIFKV
ncbi:MAG: dienelactone hydrolase family protein [Thermodesulfobacteriota bacterium]